MVLAHSSACPSPSGAGPGASRSQPTGTPGCRGQREKSNRKASVSRATGLSDDFKRSLPSLWACLRTCEMERPVPAGSLKTWGENPVSEWLAGGGGEFTVQSPYRTVGPLPGFSLGRIHGSGSLPRYLQAPVNPVNLKVSIILSKWVDELLCHLGDWCSSGNPARTCSLSSHP